MKNILLLLILIGINGIYAQKQVQKIIELNSLIDSLDKKIVKTFEYNQNGNLVKENNINFMPLNSKYRNTGNWIHEYDNGVIQKSYKINRPEKDTILIEYKYKGNKKKVTTEELVTRSKLKDSVADKYGIDSENGCVIV